MTWGLALLCILAIAVGITWIVLCYKKVIPDPVAKWTLAIAGVVFTLGLLPLIQWLAKQGGKEPEKKPIPEYIPVGPTTVETETLDNQIAETDKKLEDANADGEKLVTENKPGTANPALGKDFAERLRRLHEIKAARERQIREARGLINPGTNTAGKDPQ